MSYSNLYLSNPIKDYLKETAKWAKFISIVGLIFVGFLLIASLITGLYVGSLTSELGDVAPSYFSMAFSLYYILIALIMLIPIVFLYRFASNMKYALQYDDQNALTGSLKNLKSHYKFYGILLALMLGLYAIIIIVIIIGAFSWISLIA